MNAVLPNLRCVFFCLLGGIGFSPAASAQTSDRFPFVVPGDDSEPTITDQSHNLHRPAGKFGFTKVKDGHFFVGDERLRLWGVNLCFGANFPTHEDADKVAAHLAKLGINAVRFHHMDNQNGPGGIWGNIDKNGKRQLSNEMLDRLDYLLSKLAEHGIYSDINLHVSRELTPLEGFPVLRDVPWWATVNKYVSYYDKDVQAEWKRYAKELLTHENPYRKRSLADDPSMALVEMLNEDYFSEQGYALVSKLPERFRNSMIVAWNEWLIRKYTSTSELKKGWASKEAGLGAPLIPTAKWDSHLENWIITKDESALPRRFNGPKPSSVIADLHCLRIAPKEVTKNDYEQQLMRQGLSVTKSQPITLSFWIRAEKKRSLRMELSSLAGGEWRELGLFEDFSIDSQWQHIVRVVNPKETLRDSAYLAFSFGLDTTPIEFADIEIQGGSLPGNIPDGQNIEKMTIGIPDASFPVQAHADMKSFMVDTERDWIREFKRYLRELGVKVPITASQINYHAPGIVEDELDFADLHNYWHHPLFPSGRDWSPTEWTVGNNPMESGPTYSKWPANSLLMRAGWRVAGKPMTVTEWNYPEPSAFSAGCVPMAAVLGALQDWDAVFFFDYEASNEPKKSYFKEAPNNFFSFNAAPAKLTTLAIFSNVFLRRDVEPLREEIVSTPDKPLDGRIALAKKIGTSRTASPYESPSDLGDTEFQTPDRALIWKVQEPMKRGTMQLQVDRTFGVWGTIDNQLFEFGPVRWKVGAIERGYGILIASSMDNEKIVSSRKIVLLAATHTENQGMGWNADKTSLGTRWGQGPSMGVGIHGEIEIPTGFKKARVHALDGKGAPTREVVARIESGLIKFSISPEYKTMWYSIETD